MTTCPEHPGRTGNDLPECRWCVQEAAMTDPARGLAEVRAALAVAPKPHHGREPDLPTGTHALAIARKRIDQTQAKETRS